MGITTYCSVVAFAWFAETRMALARFRGMPAQLTPFLGFSGPVGARFWRTGIAFLAVVLRN